MFCGKGKLYKHGIVFFDGNFVKGLKHGFGIFIYENGDKFEGNFFKDEKRGKGKYYFAEGRIL